MMHEDMNDGVAFFLDQRFDRWDREGGKAGRTREENEERDGGYYWFMKLHMTAADRDLKIGLPQSTHSQLAFLSFQKKDLIGLDLSHNDALVISIQIA
ncbi:unnamed protein product [Prunus armeniaca]